MKLNPININISDYPKEFNNILSNANLYDSSCSTEARVIFIDKDNGYFLKSAPKGTLERQAVMTKYFYKKGLTADILSYISLDKDWLLMEKVHGNDCTYEKYLNEPERLCDIIAEQLAILHGISPLDCPILNHTEKYLEKARHNKQNNKYDMNYMSADSKDFGDFMYNSPEEAWAIVEKYGLSLACDTLLHGDYCLPNIILDNWKFSGFIDLDGGGAGDRHVDLFWGFWTLNYNLKTNKYHERFIDAYGRKNIDMDILKIVAAVEVFL